MPLFEILFEVNYQLCKEFPALSPYELDNTSFCDVIDLFGEVRQTQIRAKIQSDPNRIIRRKAGDNWF